MARNAAFNALARLAYLVGWALIAPFMLRRLGAERFGFWSLLAVISGLYLTFDLGLSQAFSKFVAEFRTTRDEAGLRGLFTLGMSFFAATSLLWLALVAAARDPLLDFARVGSGLRPEAGQSLVIAAVVCAAMNLSGLMGSILTGLQRMDLANQVSLGVTLAQLAGVGAILGAGGGLREILVSNGVAYAAGCTAAWWLVRRMAPEIRWDWRAFSGGLWRRVTGFGAALQIVNVGVLLQFQLPKLLYARFLSLAAAGSFELGYRVAFAAWSLPSLVLSPLLPAVSHLEAKGDSARIERLYRRASRYLFALAIPLGVGLAVLSSPLIAVWLGPGHRDTALATGALAALLAVNVLTSPGCLLVRGIGRPWIEARYHLLSLFLHIPLGVYLIPRLGFAGGLWAMFISGTVGTLYFLVALHRALGLPLLRYAVDLVARPALAALLPGALVAWYASVVAGATAGRGPAVATLLIGTLAFAALSGGAVLASRYVSLSELREIWVLALGRGPGTVPRGDA